MNDHGMVDPEFVDELLTENENLLKLIFETRRQTISVLMAFVHMSAEHSEIPASWLLAYVVNDDKSILDCETSDEWPAGYEKKVQEFCDMMAHYNNDEANSVAVKDVVNQMSHWPYPTATKKIVH